MVSLKSFKLIGERELACAERDGPFQSSFRAPEENVDCGSQLARSAMMIAPESVVNDSNMNNNREESFSANAKPTGSNAGGDMRADNTSLVKLSANLKGEVDRVSQGSSCSETGGSSISIVVVQHHDHNRTSSSPNTTTSDEEMGYGPQEDELSSNCLNAVEGQQQQQVPIGEEDNNHYNSHFKGSAGGGVARIVEHGMHIYATGGNLKQQAGQLIKAPTGTSGSGKATGRMLEGIGNASGEHFEIVWSNLSYKIEPKWYKKINFIDKVFSQFMPGQTIDSHSSATSTASSSAGMNDNQHQMHQQHQPAGACADHPHNNHPSGPVKNQKCSLDPIEIFTNLNGTIKSGQMTAVLGPSGAGKTTLLNCLTGKLRKGVSGHINLIGANGKHLKMCTIPQKDHLLELLTVEENLWFASKIKNPEFGFDHVKNIERVVDLLGLKRCRSAKIKKISGGQHKRVSIAQELLSNPDILVLDEPTSGLDSLTCYKTISMLRDLVELSASNDFMKPMAIIVTIHQPQPKVFNLFHHVYIMANGGRVIYEGAPQLSLETITTVTGLQPIEMAANKQTPAGGAVQQTGSVDPASFLIEIASEEYGLEPIKTLNDHQRRVFYENNSVFNQRTSHYQHYPATERAMINHGFAPDFADGEQAAEQAKKATGCPGAGLTTVFVEGDEYSGSTIRTNGIKSSKVKKRKKSTYSLESGFSGSSHRSGSDNIDNKSTASAASSSAAGAGGAGSGSGSGGPGSDTASLYMSEQLLYTREANHKGRFWSHTATLTHRTLLTIRRDPLLMTSRVLFHLMIPILMGHVYGKATGAANACPHYEPEIDITQIPSLVEGKRIEFMLEELHMSIENVSMFFIIMYAFAAAVLALNALSFPLNMQVLLKETRNGWYSMSSYVLAKTLADLPLELTMPCLTMALVYPLTGQPSSYLQWRMLTICLIMTLCSLIAQTQALILGALVMNSVQTAVFVSQASQLPWVILAGFTIRIKRLSEPLKLISLTSFYRLGCEAITLTRYGFGICPCDPKEISGEPVRLVGIPDQLRTLAQYWIDSMEASKAANNDTLTSADDDQLALATTTTTTTLAPASPTTGHTGSRTDIFQHLANQLSYANSYGVNITSCDDVAPDRIRAINLGDNWLVARIWHLFIMLIIMKILLYYAVKFSIGIRL